MGAGLVLACSGVLLGACSTAASVPAAPPPSPTEPAVADPPAIHWARTAAEHRAIFEQTYAWAEDVVRERAAGLEAGRWAVILDADETVLDNSTYQQRRARQGLGYTRESWNAWVREAAAPSLPGAVAFIHAVQAMGGRVFIVTNRTEEVCGPTRANLEEHGVRPAAVLCRSPGEDGKDGRFRSVEMGEAAPGVGPMVVVAWVGDNIRDFPGMGQDAWAADASALEAFGVRYFILPNPMYGSWEGNPPRGR